MRKRRSLRAWAMIQRNTRSCNNARRGITASPLLSADGCGIIRVTNRVLLHGCLLKGNKMFESESGFSLSFYAYMISLFVETVLLVVLSVRTVRLMSKKENLRAWVKPFSIVLLVLDLICRISIGVSASMIEGANIKQTLADPLVFLTALYKLPPLLLIIALMIITHVLEKRRKTTSDLD